jgi:hypothetical protein
MSILRAFSSGLRRATAEPAMVLVLYFANLLMALPVAMAFRAVLQAGFGGSMSPSTLMEGLDFTTLSDFMINHGTDLSALFRQLSWLMIVSMLLNAFLAGGVLTVLKDSRGKYTATSFFGGCGAYLGRFLRLFALFVVVLLLVSLIVGTIVGLLADALIESANSEVMDFWIRIATVVLFLLPVTILMMISDYTKVSMVLNEERSVLKSAWKSTGFVFRHFFRTFGLELLLLLVPVLLYVLYALIDLSVGISSNLTILLMMIIQQLFIALRGWAKIVFFEGELSLYESFQPYVYQSVEGSGGMYVNEPAKA